MHSFKSFLLSEDTSTAKKFYRVISFNTFDGGSYDKVKPDNYTTIVPSRFDQLSKGELLHIHGISSSPKIEIDMSSVSRNAILIMDGEEVLKLNPDTFKVDYSDFHLLSKNNFSILRRLSNYKDWNLLTPTREVDQKLTAQLMLHAFLHANLPTSEYLTTYNKNSDSDKVKSLKNKIDDGIVHLFKTEHFDSYKPIIKIILDEFNKEGIDTSKMNPDDLNVMAEQYLKKNTHSSYNKEEEWITNPTKPFFIPKDSTLKILIHNEPKVIKRKIDMGKEPETDIGASDYNKVIFGQKLSNIYKVTYDTL